VSKAEKKSRAKSRKKISCKKQKKYSANKNRFFAIAQLEKPKENDSKEKILNKF